jgi:hypothetical protein
MSIDPVSTLVQWAEEIVIGLLIVIFIALVIRYRKNLMLFFTGDDQFHTDVSECCWWSLTCCGQCTGEWTRCLTMCACCPRRLRGANLYKKTGQLFGLTTKAVEVKNIVVGDLCYKGRADFFLSVETSTNPAMVTSVAELKDPKIIHFPEVFTLRLRDSPVEASVRITVRAIHVVGFEDVAYCNVDPMKICDWAASDDPQDRCKRFELRPADSSKQPLTPPWVMMEFDQPSEVRDLEHFHDFRQTVRTAVPDGTYLDMGLGDFKREYSLVTPNGAPCHEIQEEDLHHLERLNRCLQCVGWLLTVVVTFLVVTYSICRSYMWTCWRQVAALTVAHLHHVQFPINDYNVTQLTTQCEREVEGTGLEQGQSPCLPTNEKIAEFCLPKDHAGLWPELQPRPHAFQASVKQFTGFEQQLIPCDWHWCSVREKVRDWDITIAVMVVAGPIFLCLFKMSSRKCIKSEIERLKRSGAHPHHPGTYSRQDSPPDPRIQPPRTAGYGGGGGYGGYGGYGGDGGGYGYSQARQY